MVRPSLLLCLLAACGLSLASGCCCTPCIKLPCFNSLDRHYPGSDDCLNGGPCGDPEDVGGMQTGMANCETCGRQSQLTGGCSSCGNCSSCDAWFPWMKGFTGGGCGRYYWDEWWSDPPCKCEPCDMNGNYCGGGGICRSWRLGLPMPMFNRAWRCGSGLSCWTRAHRGCKGRCNGTCGGTCGDSCGGCHIDSVGYNAADDATCSTCHSGGATMMAPTIAPPTSQPPATAPTPAPAPAPAPDKDVVIEETTTAATSRPATQAEMQLASRPSSTRRKSMAQYYNPSKMPATLRATKPTSATTVRRG